MLKIFTTQLNGIIKSISEDEYTFEDGARLLAQAALGDGHIYIHGYNEMQGVLLHALEGSETFPHAKPLFEHGKQAEVTSVDRVIIVTRHSHDEDALQLARILMNNHIPFVALSSIVDKDKEGLQDLAEVHVDLKLKKELVPTETGERIGYPSLIVALYALYAIQLTLVELIDELED